MVNTYTPKLNLAKPAHGDVDWHIPVNGNWDKIDTELDNAAKTALVSGITVDADKNWNGKSINNVNMLSVNEFKATNIRPYICVASNEIRYESLSTASSELHVGGYSPVPTATLKTYRIPTGAPYYGAGYYQMSVRVTAKCTLSYIYASTDTAVVDFWIKVDGETKKTTRLTNNATQNVTWDVMVNPSSVISLGASYVSMGGYTYATASVSDFRIRASDTFAEPQGW
jgi:hypothetical protein